MLWVHRSFQEKYELEDVCNEIEGSTINLTSDFHEYFYPLFSDSHETSTVAVTFIPEKNGQPTNEIRTLIQEMAFGTDQDRNRASRQLAGRLAIASDERSPSGLFIIIVGTCNNLTRVVLWKFAADESLQAIFAKEGLTVNVVSSAFSRKQEYFKVAVFEGNQARTSFSKGHVEDRQATHKAYEVSDLWVIRFLQAVPEVTDARGTRILAKALRQVLSQLNSLEVKQNVIAAATVLRALDNPVTLQQIAENYLPPIVRSQFVKALGNLSLVHAPFRIDKQVMDEQFGVRSLILDTSFVISGPIESFDQEVAIEPIENDGTVRIVLTGRIVDARVKTSRALQ